MLTKFEGYRVRERGGFIAEPITRDAWYEKPASPSYTSYGSLGQTGTYETMSDYVTPGFFKMSAQGLIVPSRPMSRTRTTITNTYTNGPKFEHSNGTSVGDLLGPHSACAPLKSASLPASRPAPRSIQSMIDIARTRCMANVGKPDFEGLVTLGEIRETLGYLKNPFKTGLRLAESVQDRMLGIKAASRKRLLPDEKIRKNLSDLYLEITFGFKPLVKEVTGILETLRPQLFPRPQRRTARAKEENSHKDAWTAVETQTGIQHLAEYTYEREVVVRPWILYENLVQPTSLDDWGMRLQDIPSAAWELVTLSFVADWVANIGDLISAITPRAGTRQLSHGYSVRVKESLTRKVSNFVLPVAGWSTTRAASGTETYNVETYYRVPDIGNPTLALKDLDALKQDVGRLTSLLSLTTQKLSRLGRDLPPPERVVRLGVPVNRRDRWGGRDHL